MQADARQRVVMLTMHMDREVIDAPSGRCRRLPHQGLLDRRGRRSRADGGQRRQALSPELAESMLDEAAIDGRREETTR